MQESWVQSLGWEDPLEKAGQATPVFLLGESPWTEEPDGLRKQSDMTEQLSTAQHIWGEVMKSKHNNYLS